MGQIFLLIDPIKNITAGYSYPYVVAILAKTVEVRNIQTQALVQQIELANAKILNQGKLLYIASGSQIWRLTPYSLAAQVDQLVEMFEYKEAVSLLDQMEPILLENKADKVKKIKMMYANDLFKRGQYDTAVTMFQELEADPQTVISLYPEDIAGDMHLEDTIQAGEVELADEQVPRPDIAQPVVDAAVASAAASIKSSTESARHSPKPSEYVPLTGQHLTEAVSYLIRFLTDRRQKLTKALNKQQDDERHTLLHMATQVDTALLKAYMMNNDALVGPLVRVPNHCDVEECEKLLREKKKFKELVDFYNCKGLHDQALEVLRDLGKNETGPLHGVSQTVLYLQQLDIDHFDLILKYSAWVFENDPEQGMRIFIDDMVEDNIYPRDKVLEHLEKISSDLAIEYLEYIIHELGDTTPEFHNKLILAYLQKLKAMPRNTTEQQAYGEERVRLQVFMTTSITYKAEKILSRLPYDDLYEEKAILLSRIGQHDQALNIYVYKLKNYRMAEDYCSKIYYEDPEQGHRMFLALLRVYLQPSSGGSPLIEPALELLARHGSQINVSEVLSTLPSETHLKGLYPFFEKSIRESNRVHYENMIVKNLLKAEQLQVQEKMTFYRSRSIRISEDRMCPQCNKRIGNSVFAVFPNGAVVHYFCKEKMEQQRWKLGH
ncbi:hypothetical protein K450DRAFT_217259 [Umbelopsis ramanniana AG]|uniref:Uncharacterized protein n=1 Tax=Umbelopsis ramanniana AG TaxID=1314678 RepID=A0AAD5HHG5_UMBRA|nr:uncharacterized protein K450DRAFT_217259 [Umbelopsis ramanniana AG]KAI8584642.1 hypothetical protein K450DRAFT_217259 [Umbelopsis ramanniana AG]